MSKKTPLEVGEQAPSFSLKATGGKDVALQDFVGRKNLVLYFYPKDGTPGCTTEACGFRDVHDALQRHDTVVLGVSRDPLESHERFSARHGLQFPLLCDAGDEVSKAYGVFGKKSFMGREFYGIQRTTFVIDKKGKIRRIDRKVDVKQHPGEIVDYVKSLAD
jgi:peroxiredoxin Q/BCP